jgi:acetate kinase
MDMAKHGGASLTTLFCQSMHDAVQPGKMDGMAAAILTLNAGSSSLKFALFEQGAELRRVLSGSFERLGLSHPEMRVRRANGTKERSTPVSARNVADCLPMLRQVLEGEGHAQRLAAITHRIVHGGTNFREHQWVNPDMLEALKQIVPLAPNHLPEEIGFIEAVGGVFPSVRQAACFDTVFHRDLPRESYLLPIPRRFEARGVRRYGFHGLSYASLMRQLPAHAGTAAQGRVILAHLGNGASLAAVRDGKCLDTTMGFTPLGGLVMSTRSGDLDPGVVSYLATLEKLSPGRIESLLAKESGLKGMSETSGDVRDLLAREGKDARAADALAVFCHQARKYLGAMAAVLGGVEVLVFAGGIGENAAVLRERICAPLEHLGIRLDAAANAVHGPLISHAGGGAQVFVLKTDEEQEMAEIVRGLLQTTPPFSKPKKIKPSPVLS